MPTRTKRGLTKDSCTKKDSFWNTRNNAHNSNHNGSIIALSYDDLKNTILQFEYLRTLIAILPNLAYLKDVENNRYIYINNHFKAIFNNESIQVTDLIDETISIHEKKAIEDNHELLDKKIYPLIHSDGSLHELQLNFYPLSIESIEKKYILVYGTQTTSKLSSASLYLIYKNHYSDEKTALDNFFTAIGLSEYLDGKKITLREFEVLLMLSKGLSAKEIARVLNFSGRTAENHIMNIKEKFSVNSNIELLSIFLSCYRIEG